MVMNLFCLAFAFLSLALICRAVAICLRGCIIYEILPRSNEEHVCSEEEIATAKHWIIRLDNLAAIALMIGLGFFTVMLGCIRELVDLINRLEWLPLMGTLFGAYTMARRGTVISVQNHLQLIRREVIDYLMLALFLIAAFLTMVQFVGWIIVAYLPFPLVGK